MTSPMRQVWMTEDGWVAERLEECTCSPHYGHHEPTCGWEPIGKLNDAAPLHAAIEALCDEWSVVALVDDLTRRLAREVPVTADQVSWINGMATAFVELKKALPDGAAALREHDLHVISDAEQRMFGTTDPGEYIEIADGIPVSKFQRLLWEPYRDTSGEAGDGD